MSLIDITAGRIEGMRLLADVLVKEHPEWAGEVERVYSDLEKCSHAYMDSMMTAAEKQETLECAEAGIDAQRKAMQVMQNILQSEDAKVDTGTKH